MFGDYYSWLTEAGNWLGFGAILAVFAVVIVGVMSCYYMDFHRWSGKRAVRTIISSALAAFAAPWVWFAILPLAVLWVLVWSFTPDHVDSEDMRDWIVDHTIGAFRR